jgi:uncharacterized protein
VAAYYFDTSGLVKCHVSENGTAWVRSLTRPQAGHTIFLARITGVEMFAAISRRQRGGSLSPAQAGAILGHFRRHLSQRYNVVEVTPVLMADAMLLTRKHGLRAYDAVQLAVSISVHQGRLAANLSSLVLISADHELNGAAQAEGLAVDDPNLHP